MTPSRLLLQHFLAALGQDPYSLLAVHPHADFAEVLQRVARAERRLDPGLWVEASRMNT